MNRADLTLTRAAFAAVLAAAIVAGCSSGAGFGGAPPYQGGQQQVATPPGGYASPYIGESPDTSPTPETPLGVDSATARFAYDASAADPVKAPPLVEVTFALSNDQSSPMPVNDVAVAADTATPTHVTVALQAVPDQDTVETVIAVAPPKDYSKTKKLALTFGDGKGKMLAQDSIDFPTTLAPTMTALDKKQSPGSLSIDDVSISSVQAPGTGFHYDLTFSATNAGTTDASIAYFTVTPPKSDTVKIVVPTKIPARNEMAPVSIVVPYVGKSKTLPSGTYIVTAQDAKNNIIAQGSGPLL
jgi:hypothetical protein